MKRYELTYVRPGMKSLADREKENLAFIQAENEMLAVANLIDQVGRGIRVIELVENKEGTLK